MKYQNRVLGMLSILALITYLDRVCIAVAGPRMQQVLHISPQGWGWITGIFFITYSAFEIPAGALGDRVGPRRVLARIVAWWSVFTSLTGAVSNYYLLLFVRLCFGAGEAGAYPNASSVISRWIPISKRARAWGVILMTSQLGAACSPLLVVPIQAHFGWRAPFFTFGIIGLAWSAAWYFWFRDSPRQMRAITEAELQEIGSAFPEHSHSIKWALALRLPALWRIAAICACYTYALGFFQSWLQTYLVKGRGFTEAALLLSTFIYAAGAIGNTFGGLGGDALVKRLGLRAGRRVIGIAGLTLAALFLLAAISAKGPNAALFFLSFAYAGILFQQPSMAALCLDVGRKNSGAVFGFMNMAGYAASALSSIVFGYLVAYSGSYQAPFFPMAILLCVGALLWWQVDPTQALFPDHTA